MSTISHAEVTKGGVSVTVDRDTQDDVQFQLAVPAELADALEEISGVSAERAGKSSEGVRHELALETVGVVLTILVNAKDLAPVCRRIAETIHGFFGRRDDRDPRVKVVGEKDEAVLEIRLEGIDVTADNIRVVITR